MRTTVRSTYVQYSSKDTCGTTVQNNLGFTPGGNVTFKGNNITVGTNIKATTRNYNAPNTTAMPGFGNFSQNVNEL